VIGRASAKLILFGEHAVVHGAAAVAVPVPERETEVEVEPHPGPEGAIEVEDARGIDVGLAREMVRVALRQAGRPGGARVRIRSTIAVGAGLGSSAALSVALVRAVAGSPITPEETAERALELEKLAHGTPSGVDSTTIAWGRPIGFLRGNPPQPIALASPVRLAVGVLSREGTTASLVAGVRALAERERDRFKEVLAYVSWCSREGRAALERGDAARLGYFLSVNQDSLRRLGVSTPAVERACSAALEAGALGAKLSGAGGGGAIVAAIGPETEAAAVLGALHEAGAREAFLTEVR
jgi:mevalonate kinase